MSDAASTLRLEVSAGGDVLSQERLTPDLRDEFTALDGIDVAFGAPGGLAVRAARALWGRLLR